MIFLSIPQGHSVTNTRSLRAVLTNTTQHGLGNIKSKELVIITFDMVYWYQILIYQYDDLSSGPYTQSIIRFFSCISS